jgi:O-antigen/teichoic acid export membrane protein
LRAGRKRAHAKRRLRNVFAGGTARQGALAFVATMLPNVFFFAYHVLMSRLLGVEGYGELSSLNSFLVLTAIPASIATTVIVKYTAEFKAVEDWGKLRAFAARSTLAGAAVALAGIGLTALLCGPIGAYLHIGDPVVIWLTGLSLGINLVLPLARGVIQGLQHFGKLAVSASIDALGRAAFGMLLVHAGFGLRGAVAGVALATGCSLIYTLAVVFGPRIVEKAALAIDLRRLLQSSTGVSLSTIFGTILGFADLPMVKHFFPAQDAGLYGAASLAGKMVLYALAFVPMLVLPLAAGRSAKGEASALVWIAALAVTAAIAAPALLVFALLPDVVLRALTGSAYLDAAPLLLPYGVAMTFMAGLNSLAAFNVGAHRFAFLVPLGLAAAAQVAGIEFFHLSLVQVVHIVAAANAFAFFGAIACSWQPAAAQPAPLPNV